MPNKDFRLLLSMLSVQCTNVETNTNLKHDLHKQEYYHLNDLHTVYILEDAVFT